MASTSIFALGAATGLIFGAIMGVYYLRQSHRLKNLGTALYLQPQGLAVLIYLYREPTENSVYNFFMNGTARKSASFSIRKLIACSFVWTEPQEEVNRIEVRESGSEPMPPMTFFGKSIIQVI